jgi:hypothetical protein
MLMPQKVEIQRLNIHILSIQLSHLAHFPNIKIMILHKKSFQIKRLIINNIKITLFKM